MKIKELLEYGKNNLIGKAEPYRLSKMLLKYILKVEDIYLVINSNNEVETNIEVEYKKGLELIKKGMPLQYITNKQEFMRLGFYVDENVLIPQPDTEILVEEALNIIKNNDNMDNIKILDLCTGSGAIGISLAKNVTNAEVTMSDISQKALEIATKNALQNKVENRCKFVNSNMFETINEKYDVIVSNPPYIKTEIIKTLDKEVQNEPILALDGGIDGLEFYKEIANNAYKYLTQNGMLLLEIGYDQKEDVIKLLQETKEYKDIYSKKDLAGNDRIVVCKLKCEVI